MLKLGGRGVRDGKPLQMMVIGLSHANLDRLREGKPIKASGSDFGIETNGAGDIQVIVFSGRTEQEMAREFADLIGEKTRVTIDPRLRD